jgi:hypothetical protein
MVGWEALRNIKRVQEIWGIASVKMTQKLALVIAQGCLRATRKICLVPHGNHFHAMFIINLAVSSVHCIDDSRLRNSLNRLALKVYIIAHARG